MELRHMRYFVAVAEELSFVRAAKRLRISQQPLSQQIRNLEAEIGVKLFDRTTRRVELTEAGSAFLTEVYRVLAQTEAAVKVARRVSRGETGMLGIGYTPTAFYDVLPGVLRKFRSLYPDVGLDLVELNSTRQEEALISGRTDIGFLYPPAENPGIRTEVVSSHPLVAVLPDDHRLAEKEPLSVLELADEPFVTMVRSNRPELHDRLIKECRSSGFTPDIVQEAGDIQALLGLVASGFGVALTIESFRHLSRPGIVYRSLEKPEEILSFAVAWRDGDSAPALKNFLEVTRKSGSAPFGTV